MFLIKRLKYHKIILWKRKERKGCHVRLPYPYIFVRLPSHELYPAAVELHITQPAVSQHIRYLEREYGAKLFSYKGKHLQLTQAGHILWNAATAISHDDTLLKEHLRDLQHHHSLSFGATPTAGMGILDKLSVILKQNGDMNLRMEIADADKLLQSLDKGTIDFAIVESSFDQGHYDSLLFSTEPIVAVCSDGYEAPDEMTLADLMHYRLIIGERMLVSVGS